MERLKASLVLFIFSICQCEQMWGVSHMIILSMHLTSIWFSGKSKSKYCWKRHCGSEWRSGWNLEKLYFGKIFSKWKTWPRQYFNLKCPRFGRQLTAQWVSWWTHWRWRGSLSTSCRRRSPTWRCSSSFCRWLFRVMKMVYLWFPHFCENLGGV